MEINLKELGHGCEGTVYEVNNNTAIKIFYHGVNFTYIKPLFEFNQKNKTYIFPERIFNINNFRGYTMKKINKNTLNQIDLNKYTLSTLSLAFKILEIDTKKISYEHLVFNDLNYNNVMFDGLFSLIDCLEKNSSLSCEECYKRNIKDICNLIYNKLFDDIDLLKKLYQNNNIKNAYMYGLPYKCPSLFFQLLENEIKENLTIHNFKQKIKS